MVPLHVIGINRMKIEHKNKPEVESSQSLNGKARFDRRALLK